MSFVGSLTDRSALPPDFVDWILEGTKTATTRIDNFVTEEGETEIVGDLQRGDLVRAVTPEGRSFAVLTITGLEHRTLAELDGRTCQGGEFVTQSNSGEHCPVFIRRSQTLRRW